jgi:hypothetical protein
MMPTASASRSRKLNAQGQSSGHTSTASPSSFTMPAAFNNRQSVVYPPEHVAGAAASCSGVRRVCLTHDSSGSRSQYRAQAHAQGKDARAPWKTRPQHFVS